MIILITNSIVPYCFDIAQVLGLPNNLSHRFRYLSKWVHRDCTLKGIHGRVGLVVLRNYETAEFLPVRFVTIDQVSSVGDIHYLEFRVGGYYPPDKIALGSAKIQEALDRKGVKNRPANQLDCLVFDADDILKKVLPRAIADSDANYWNDILRKLGSLDCFKDFSFLKFLGVRTGENAKALVAKDDTEKYSIKLAPGQLYYLDVMQHVPSGIDETESIGTPYDVELKAETDAVTILRSVQRVVGKYDLLRFIFKTPPGYASKHSFLEIVSKQTVNEYGLPSLFLPITIQSLWWMTVLRWVGRIAGVVAIMVFIAAQPFAACLGYDPNSVRTIALLALIFSARKWDEVASEIVKSVVPKAKE